jgi:hypothetical protein
MAQFKAFPTDGACVRTVALPKHDAIVTAHANGMVVLRRSNDLLAEIARKQTTEAEAPSCVTPATAVLFDAVATRAQDCLIVSVNDGGSYKVVAFELPSLSFRSILCTRSLPARALAVSSDDALMYVRLSCCCCCVHTT